MAWVEGEPEMGQSKDYAIWVKELEGKWHMTMEYERLKNELFGGDDIEMEIPENTINQGIQTPSPTRWKKWLKKMTGWKPGGGVGKE